MFKFNSRGKFVILGVASEKGKGDLGLIIIIILRNVLIAIGMGGGML